MNTVTQTAVATAEALTPVILAAAVASNPQAQAVAALAPVAIQFLQNANALHNAGALSQDQLAYMFSSIGTGVQSTHDKWVAMNAAEAVAKPQA